MSSNLDPDPLAPLGRLQFETAAEHVCRNVPVFAPDASAARMRAELESTRFELCAVAAVVDGGRLCGIVRIEDLLPAPPTASAAELMDSEPPTVAPGLDQERAAWHAVRHRESALAVLEEDGRFAGFVPPARLLEVLLWEHNEDMARLGGVLRRASLAHRAEDEPLVRRLWRRLPWLVLGLAGALLAAAIVQRFEAVLDESLLLAMFLPGVIYLADAVGTQTETLVVRGLSLGFSFRHMAYREAVTGIAIALVLSGVFFLVADARWGHPRVIGAVAVALLAATAGASLVAMTLPWLLHRLGTDPAIGSGPLATVAQDLLSITVYFLIAERML